MPSAVDRTFPDSNAAPHSGRWRQQFATIGDELDAKAPVASPTFTGLATFAGVKPAVGTVSGALTLAAHGGGVFVTDGAITLPNVAGFTVVLIAGGAHDVNAGGAATSLAAGDVLEVWVPAAGTVKARHTLAANTVDMPTSPE